MLIPALDSVLVMIDSGFNASFWVVFVWNAANSWLNWLVLLVLELLLLELLSASLAAPWE